VQLVEQELFTLPEYLSSPPVFSGVRVTRSLVLYICFVDRCLFFCTFSFGHCVVCSIDIRFLIAPLVSSNSSLTKSPILVYPSLEKEFLLDTDASGFGLGAVLSQIDPDN